ncbi:HAD hydrolase-like protein [Candidatus Thioglobus sp.]|jgi:phosphoglycolate phosphatase-like HAD superfamily hydrolase|nr:HAD hydrolase-like protein [Candidatus Thioglobus sp.]
MHQVSNIFFDFDGVIKESVEVKTFAFIELFQSFKNDVLVKIKKHHLKNSGMSRYEKIPIYLDWAGEKNTDSQIEKYAENFSLLVKEKVISSNWVDGVESFLKRKKNDQLFFILTATPQDEIEDILDAINIRHLFDEVIGSPTKKSNAIKFLLSEYSLTASNSLMIGDSRVDYEAALYNSVPFILRRTSINKNLQNSLNCQMINNFLYE